MKVVLLAVALLGVSSAPAENKIGDLRKVGATKVATSCSKAVQPEIDRAVALLHSFFYDESRRVFTSVTEKDPGCAMAQWGVAMTYWHPLWTPPSEQEMKDGLAAAERAEKLGAKKPIEKGLIEAIVAFYRTPAATTTEKGGQSCHGPTGGDHRSRALAYTKVMEQLHAKHPKDVEVATFYSLALLGTAVPTDKTLANQKKATEILERFWKTNRTHPGIAHYLIHGYDYPQTAEKGLPAAKAYAQMAPWVPHVLHMPSHIFTRLGMWPEVVDSNLASADAARQYAASRSLDAMWFEELHALDYLVYGYLQQGDDARAKDVAQRVAAVERTVPEIDFVVAYALGAVPARYALERKQWEEASALTLRESPIWAKFPFARANVEFARALGFARLGKTKEANESHARLETLAADVKDPRFEYFAKQTRMQAQIVRGWIAHADSRAEDATRTLIEAADQDDLLGKHPVSPGSLLPAREVLADYYFETGRFQDALTQYEATLALNPKRLSTLHGAARAAEKAGDKTKARKYHGDVLGIAMRDSTRAEVVAAKAFLGGT